MYPPSRYADRRDLASCDNNTGGTKEEEEEKKVNDGKTYS